MKEIKEQLYNKYELVGRVTKQSVYLKRTKRIENMMDEYQSFKLYQTYTHSLTYKHKHTQSKRKTL